jgi:ABC-type dipeptide/oligopeptide/nickel transport system permease subunit
MSSSSKNDVSKRRGAGQWAVAWRRFKKHKSGLFGLGMIIVLLFVAAFHNYIAPYPAGSLAPLYQGDAGQPPSLKYLFGTSVGGSDVYSEVLHGAIYTVYVAFSGTIITMVICIAVGIVAGYMGKYIDEVLMRITEIFLVFPSLMLILVFARIFQLRNSNPYWNLLGIQIPIGLTMVILIVSVFAWSPYARVIRGEVLRLKEAEFIQASKGIGANSRWIMIRHILPNVLPQIVVLATLTMAGIVLTEAGVSFLGFGDPNTITWGRLMEESFPFMSTAWLA